LPGADSHPYAGCMAVSSIPDLAWLEEQIADALEDAGTTLLCMPTAGDMPPALRWMMPADFISAVTSAHRLISASDRLGAPTPREIDDAEIAFGWVTNVPELRWRYVLLMMSLVHPRTAVPFFGADTIAPLMEVQTSSVLAWRRKGIHAIGRHLYRVETRPSRVA
jgi:hypothetical protein